MQRIIVENLDLVFTVHPVRYAPRLFLDFIGDIDSFDGDSRDLYTHIPQGCFTDTG